MNVDEAREIVQVVKRAAEPETLPTLSLPQLQKHYHSLCQARLVLLQHSYTTASSDDLLRTLRQEIESKRTEEHSERHHTQAMNQGSNILFWTKCAVVAAVVVPIVVALIAEIPLSRLLHAKASQALAASSKQTPATVGSTTTPTAIESPSESPQASPTPELTSTPAQTPIKFPPPAP